VKSGDYVCERIDELLKGYHMTYYQLVQKTGLAKGTIYGIKNRNRIPEYETICRICEEGFGISVASFYQIPEACDYVLTNKEKEYIDIFRQIPSENVDSAVAYLKWLTSYEK
jgi:transcriptional regulator with XRE-family HTH domain